LSVGVSQRGHTIWQWNFGTRDVDASLAPDSSTVYGIGSLTKCFTATAIAQLVKQGKLSYNTRIKDILPDFKSRNPAVTDLATVEDLLAHRLGLAKSNHWWYGAEGELLLEKADLLPAVSDLQPITGFRAAFDYSNWCYALAGEIIERVTGESYGEYIKGAIASPLGLCSTTAIHDDIPEANIAKPYAALDDGTFALLPRPKSQDGLIMCPAQGILSSVDDLLVYSSALMSAFQGITDSPQRPKLKGVDTQLFGRIFTAQTRRESSYALGFHRHQLPGAITATGANGMFVKQQPQLTPGKWPAPRGIPPWQSCRLHVSTSHAS
jgi:CubicO group peptidase (beta-lactamase class C family)